MNDSKPKMVSMTRAFQLFWMNYVNFTGKSSRSEYWWWYLWNAIIGLVLSIPFLSVLPRLFQMLMDNNLDSQIGDIIAPILVSVALLSIYGLGSLLPQIAILLRRLRDVGLPEGVSITLVVARYVINFIPFLYFISIFLNIALLVITILPTNTRKR